MPLLLVLEDTAADAQKAASIALRAGFTERQTCRFASDAKLYLEKAMRGQAPLPDAMVVDLDLGIESGFELLRFWHGSPRLKAVPVIVWTVMSDRQREICGLFGVQYCISKDDDPEALSAALVAALPNKGGALRGE